MGWRNAPLSLAAVLVSQLFLAGAAVAQVPAVGEPKPTEDQPTAQDAEAGTPKRAKKAAEEEIVVTGSRVRRKDLTTPAPITVINKEQVQASGKISIGDFLQTLPEQGNAINTAVNNGSTGSGATRVSLRGLGTQRTLVLMNGRRFVPGGPGADGSVDLSSIPVAGIERIEVLKDGASAVYGSDAIGGVVNLITRKRMNGVEMGGYAGTSTHSDGSKYEISGVAGTSGDRGSILFAGGWANERTVWAGARDFAAVPRVFSTTGTGLVSRRPGESTQGSRTVPAGTFSLGTCTATTRPNVPCVSRPGIDASDRRIVAGSDPRIDFYNNLIRSTPLDQSTFLRTTRDDALPKICDDRPGGTGACWRGFTTTELQPNGGDGYNFQPENYLVTPQQRIQLFTIGETKLGELSRGYFEASYVNRQGGQTLAPEPLNLRGEGVTVSANNAYNPFGIDLIDVSKRLLEFGTRDFRQDIDTFRIVAGVDGTLPEEAGLIKGWFWDVSFNFGRTVGSNTKRGNLFIPAVQDAVGPTFTDAQGVLRCGTAANPIADCVPLNLLGGENTITSDQITPIIAYTGNQRGFNQMVAAQFNTAGELFKLLAERPVGLALGYEYRIVSGQNIPDPITVAGLTTGNKGSITGGHYYVNEGYGELSIPILSGVPFAESIEGSAAVRVFNYSNFGSDATYKFGGRWTLVRDFTLRGTYSTGFRAPSIPDLFQGLGDAFPSASDPCRGPAAGGGPVPQNCLDQGISAAGTGDRSTQLRARVGGNPLLRPEKANIYTAGVVFEPRWLRGFSATLDYYNIEINKSITPIGAQLILNQCYPGDANTAPRFCELVQRDPLTLRVSNIININQNIGKDATDGLDLALNYLLPTEVGRFNFIFDGTWLHKFDRTLIDGSVIHGKNTYDIAITLPGGGLYPAFKFIAGMRWSLSGLDVGVNTRFFSSFHECGTRTGLFNGTSSCYDRQQQGDPIVFGPGGNARTVSAYNAWDLFASYAFKSFAGRTTVGAGVNNIFNSNPPTIYNGFLAASDPTAYADGFIGRFFYGRVAQSF